MGSSRVDQLILPVLYKNQLLATLPAVLLQRLAFALELVRLETGCVLYESGERLHHVYFPTNSIVSLRCELESGSSGEIAVVGNDGAVGIAWLLGGQPQTSQAVVCSAGFALRITADVLLREFEHGGALQHCLLCYMQALITQTAQTTVCNRFHGIEQQLCRWMLLRLDRMASNELLATHELIAIMLGVRRESVTQAAGKLQAAGLIHYKHGRILVLDRQQLEALVCECYAVVTHEYHRLLPQLTTH